MVISLLVACVPYNGATEPGPTPAVEVGPAGGTVEADGVTLTIPAGALNEPVEIVITDTETAPPEDYEGLSTVWTFEPDGLVFAEPVTVSIPYDDTTPFTRMFWSTEDGDGFEVITAGFADGVASAEIEHFSSGFVAITPSEEFTWDEYYAPADVLVVVDDSCSMFEEQQQLGANSSVIFDAFEQSGLDFHLGVVTTDVQAVQNAGKLRMASGERFITPTTANAQQTFNVMETVGTAGWYEEKGRAAAYTLLELQPDIPRNTGFYREDATLDILMLSDEEDQSGSSLITVPEFNTWLEELKPDPSMATSHAIVGIPGALCTVADTPGSQYINYATESDGEVIDICDTDWSPGLQAIVDRRLASAFVELDQEPGEILEVAFDADSAVRLVLTDTEYTLDGSFIRFDLGVYPEVDDTVRVRYRPL